MNIRIVAFVLFLLALVIRPVDLRAHGGGLDANGGHNDNSTTPPTKSTSIDRFIAPPR